MSYEIWKYRIPLVGDLVTVEMKEPAYVISAGIDPQGKLCVWAWATPKEGRSVAKAFAVLFTGQSTEAPVPNTKKFLGTHNVNGLIIHIWEL